MFDLPARFLGLYNMAASLVPDWRTFKPSVQKALDAASAVVNETNVRPHQEARRIILPELKKLPLAAAFSSSWVSLAQGLDSLADGGPFTGTPNSATFKVADSWVTGGTSSQDVARRKTSAAKLCLFLQEVLKHIEQLIALDGSSGGSLSSSDPSKPSLASQQDAGSQPFRQNWTRPQAIKCVDALIEELGPYFAILATLSHSFPDNAGAIFLPARFTGVTDVFPHLQSDPFSSLAVLKTTEYAPDQILRAYRVWVHAARLQAGLVIDFVHTNAPAPSLAGLQRVDVMTDDWGSAALAGKRKTPEPAPSTEPLGGAGGINRRVTDADRNLMGKGVDPALLNGKEPDSSAPALSGPSPLCGFVQQCVPQTGLFKGIDLAIKADTDASAPVDTWKFTAEGAVPQLTSEYTSVSAFIHGEMDRLRGLPTALGASFKLYFEWILEESRIKSWEFLKHWDRSLRQRIKDGRLPNFDPVCFGSQYVHFQREWSEEPKNRHKSMDIWTPPTFGGSQQQQQGGHPRPTRPNKRQRTREQQRGQGNQQQGIPKKKPQGQQDNGGNPSSDIICRNFAANGTCPFNPCKFKH